MNFKSDAISYYNISVSMPVPVVQLVDTNPEGLNLTTAVAG